MNKLLNKENFRNSVFERDNHKCVICDQEAVDAHHIIDRRLWNNGGYYLNNGASLCEIHHIKAEKTEMSCDHLREKIGITNPILPEHLYKDYSYDKWGNIILKNGNRLRGELFYHKSVQKTLEDVLHLFITYIKYPRTYHLPWSLGKTNDDRSLKNVSDFEGKEVIVTQKMDGEQTSIYNNYIHARSINSSNHISRSWIKNLHGKFSYKIPDNWRICGENLYAKHSIHYKKLPSYFMVFSIWNNINECLSWDDTEAFSKMLNLEVVPIFYRGLWDKNKIKELQSVTTTKYGECEGYVVRLSDKFKYQDFKKSVAKCVRKNHVKTNSFWMRQIVPNLLN